MTVSTSVKWAVSSMTGAPTLNGTAGSLIVVLDAFLVNGFSAKAVDSATVTDGICRMNITGASAAQDHCVIQLAGLTGSGVVLNGLQRVKTATASYVEFACDLPDGPLTGTITFKIAPLGWEKVFSKTNVAVYRSTDVAGTRAYYRVDDTNALYTRVTMYESMSDVDTGVGVAPSLPSGGFYWHKRSAAAATGVYWVLHGDSRGFYISVAPNAASSSGASNGYGLYTYYAGDINSYRSGDAWCAALTGAESTVWNVTDGCVSNNAATAGVVIARQSLGIGVSYKSRKAALSGGAAYSGGDAYFGTFPSRADNGLRLSPILLSDAANSFASGPRGEFPGVFHSPQTDLSSAFGADTGFQIGTGVFAGQVLSHVASGPVNAGSTGVLFWTLADWRAQ